VTAKTAAASSGQLADNTSMDVSRASHGKGQRGLVCNVPRQTQVRPHVQYPTANTDVVSRSMSHGELQLDLTSNIPWQTTTWPHIQRPVVNTRVVSHLTSHGQHQDGLTSNVPPQTQPWLCIQCPHVHVTIIPSVRSKPEGIQLPQSQKDINDTLFTKKAAFQQQHHPCSGMGGGSRLFPFCSEKV